MSAAGAAVPESRVEPMHWTFDPWREHRGRATLGLLGSTGLIATAVWFRLPLPVVTALALSVLALLAPGFLPTYCTVDARGVSRRIGFMPPSLRPWHSIHAAALSSRGLHVATREWRAPLSALQQMCLPLPHDEDAASLRARLREVLGGHGY